MCCKVNRRRGCLRPENRERSSAIDSRRFGLAYVAQTSKQTEDLRCDCIVYPAGFLGLHTRRVGIRLGA